MRTHQDGIFYACLRRVGNREDAEDICSQVFLRAVRSINGYRGDASIKTWLHSIAANLCNTHLGKRDAQRYINLDEISDKLEAPVSSADKATAEAEIRRALVRALNQLDPALREAFHLRTFEEMSYDDIARITKAPINTVKTRIFRAREHLQLLLAEHRL